MIIRHINIPAEHISNTTTTKESFSIINSYFGSKCSFVHLISSAFEILNVELSPEGNI